MPAFPVQDGDIDIWGTKLREFFGPYFDLATGALKPDVVLATNVAPGEINPVHLFPQSLTAPDNLQTSTSSALAADGTVIAELRLTWDQPPEPGIDHYQWRIKEGVGGNYVYGISGNAEQRWTPLKPGITYYVGVRAIDRMGNKSAYSADLAVLVAADDTVPQAPTGLAAVAAFRTAFLDWTNPPDSDLSHVEVWRAGTNDRAGAALIGTVGGGPSQKARYIDEGRDVGSTAYYWVRAVDTSANPSAYQPAGATAGVAGTTRAIGDAQGSLEIALLVVDDGHIANVNAGKITAGDIATARLQVNAGAAVNAGTTDLATARLQANAGNAVNAGSVAILPGLIAVSGGTTLADWRYGGDLTLIDGGDIAANTILANKAVIGLRGVTFTGCEVSAQTPTANTLYWSAGTVEYIDDAGAATFRDITGSNALWSSGTLYLYWAKGATTLSTTTDRATAFGADNVVIASYKGTTDLVANYGRTIIDGSDIVTGTIVALGTVTTGILQNAAGTLSLNLNTGLLTVNLAGGLQIAAADGLTVLSGAALKLNAGGDIYLTDSATDPSEIRFRRAADVSQYWSLKKGADGNNTLSLAAVGLAAPYLLLGGLTSDQIRGVYISVTGDTPSDGFSILRGTSGTDYVLQVSGNALDANIYNDLQLARTGAKLRLNPYGSSPEGLVTAYPGTCLSGYDAASSTWKFFFKHTGSGTNTGWKSLARQGVADVGTGELKTATGVTTATIHVDITLNDYSFFPSYTNTVGQNGIRTQPVADPGNTIGRFRHMNFEGGTTTVRWRYVTASDQPTIWVMHDAVGAIVAVWMSDDPLPNNEPGLGAVEPGHTVVEIPRADLDVLLPLISAAALARGNDKASSGDRVAYRALWEAFKNPAEELMARCTIALGSGRLQRKGA